MKSVKQQQQQQHPNLAAGKASEGEIVETVAIEAVLFLEFPCVIILIIVVRLFLVVAVQLLT